MFAATSGPLHRSGLAARADPCGGDAPKPLWRGRDRLRPRCRGGPTQDFVPAG